MSNIKKRNGSRKLTMHNNLAILKFLIENKYNKYSARDLCKELDMSISSLRWAMIDLLVQNFVLIKRGKPKLYYLNKELFN